MLQCSRRLVIDESCTLDLDIRVEGELIDSHAGSTLTMTIN